MWKLKLKDGREVAVRLLTEKDKVELFEMFSSMSEKALEWSMAPYTMEVIERWTNNISNLIPLVAEYGSRIVGYASIYRFSHPRRKGVGDQGIYLHQDFHNVGLGTAMMGKLLQLAKKEDMHKIELTVVADNKVAIHLYEKLGFKVEGMSKDSFYGSDQKYHDMVHMGLTLDYCVSNVRLKDIWAKKKNAK
nr:GNAT family N-acetyltransferase [Candidatus Njordarchaeota archaeon]